MLNAISVLNAVRLPQSPGTTCQQLQRRKLYHDSVVAASFFGPGAACLFCRCWHMPTCQSRAVTCCLSTRLVSRGARFAAINASLA